MSGGVLLGNGKPLLMIWNLHALVQTMRSPVISYNRLEVCQSYIVMSWINKMKSDQSCGIPVSGVRYLEVPGRILSGLRRPPQVQEANTSISRQKSSLSHARQII